MRGTLQSAGWQMVLVICLSGTAAGEEADVAAWRACRDAVAELETLHQRLEARADSVARARATARAAADRAAEQRWLARGEAVADSLRSVATALLAQELVCRQLAEPVRTALSALLAGGVDGTGRDSLLALEQALRDAAWPGLPREFRLPQASPADPPEILRQKAAFARDVADRINRWIGFVEAEAEAWEARGLSAASERLLADEAFFDEQLPAGLSPPPSASAMRASWWRTWLQRLPEAVQPAGLKPEEVLAQVRAWLRERRNAAFARAVELEAEANAREREP